MTKQEWLHLKEYINCKRLEREHRSTNSTLSKRAVKANGLGIGFIGKKSRIISEVPLEKYFRQNY
jgi:hypothetical protein